MYPRPALAAALALTLIFSIPGAAAVVPFPAEAPDARADPGPFPSSTAGADVIRAALATITPESWAPILEELVRYGNRQTGTTQNNNAAAWIKAEFEAAGLTVTYDPFSNSQNIVGVKAPERRTSNGYIVVGGHMDGVPAATGGAAEDNGSGTAATIALARALAPYAVDTEIRFIAFSGEEQGLVGSNSYTNKARDRGDQVIAMFNLDMIAYNPSSNNQFKLFENAASRSLADYTIETLGLYRDAIGLSGAIRGAGAANSDHYPFWQKGWPAVFVHSYHFTPDYHQAGDKAQTLNYTFATKTTRLVGATLGRLANLHPLGDVEVLGLQVLNPDARTGDVVNLRATLANPSAADFGEVVVSFRADGAEQERRTIALPALTTLTLDFAWSSAGAIGDHAFEVVADPDGRVAETNELNNRATASVSVDAPDLLARAPSDAAWSADGARIWRATIRATVENARAAPAGGFDVAFYYDQVQPENRIGTVRVPGLAGLASTEVEATWELSRPGDHTILVVVDEGGAVLEWSEANNGAGATFPFFVGVPLKVELPDPSRTEWRDADADGVPRLHVWWDELWVRSSGLGFTPTGNGGYRDTGVGDPDDG